jgi:hypothetical protein
VQTKVDAARLISNASNNDDLVENPASAFKMAAGVSALLLILRYLRLLRDYGRVVLRPVFPGGGIDRSTAVSKRHDRNPVTRQKPGDRQIQ